MQTTENTLITDQNSAVLANLKPQSLWNHFGTLCEIPRDSYEEKDIATYIFNLAEESGLVVRQDKLYNTLVTLPASPGLEHLPYRCLQSHVDMVCLKNPCIESLFPIQLVLVDNDKILTANGTTLGADNGIGAAAMMTLITDPSVEHGPLELLFTTVEEKGLVGAAGFDYSWLQSKQIINLDSEEEGVIFVGCAGGGRVKGTLTFDPVHLSQEYCKYAVSVKDFTGGHSGIEIHHNHGNAIKVLAEMLLHMEEAGIRIVDFSGGEGMTAIPKQAQATILVKKEDTQRLWQFFEESRVLQCAKYAQEKPVFRLEKISDTAKDAVLRSLEQTNLLYLLCHLPNGVIHKDPKNPKMVQTSNNVGLVRMKDNSMEIASVYRSSLRSSLDETEEWILQLLRGSDAIIKCESKYLPWPPQYDTPLLHLVSAAHSKVFEKDPSVQTIHAGLECAQFYNNMVNVEIVSFGPTMGKVHSTNEWVDIRSVKEFYTFLCEVIKSE